MSERAQSTVLGFTMVVGLLVVTLLVIQTSAVPAWNQDIEYAHNERVQGEMELLRDDVYRAASTGSASSQTLTLGAQYPVRPFLFNPADPTAQLRTTDPGTVTITNATATGETGDYWNGSTRSFDDRALIYDPTYNEYRNAPTTVFENSVLYNRFSGPTLPITGATLISGRRITLVTLAGDLSRSGRRPQSVELRPLSAPQQVTTVRSDGPMVVTAPTRLSEETWEDLLADERVAAGGYVTDVSVTSGDPGTLRVTLAAGRSYDLRMARIGVGSQLQDPPARYITTDSPSELQLTAGGTERVVFEVRDRYNNPVSGVRVNASVTGSGTLRPVDAVTDSDGHAVFQYETVDAGTATITGTFGTDPGVEQTANVTVESVAAESTESLGVEWIGPSAGENDVYTLDGGVTNSTVLTLASSPPIEGLAVQYIVGDQSIGTVSSASRTTNAAGLNNITFTAKRDGTVAVYAIGGGDVDVMTITVTNLTGNDPPSAAFAYRPGSAAPGATVSFDGTGSSDPDGTIQSYEWRFGDGTTATGPTPSHSYASPGTYTVRLTVTDDGGATDTVTKTVTVNAPPSIDSVTVTDQSVTRGSAKYAQFQVDYTISDDIQLDRIRFTVVRRSDNARIIDETTPLSGTSASGSETIREPDQTAQVRGQTYDVTITVVDSDGKTSSVTRTITVQ